jgi:hypothetical protein
VNKASTSAVLTSSSNPSDFGATVTFSATVSAVAPGGGTPTGTVTFMDGTKSLANITMNAGKALFSTSTLSIGVHSITAVYNGDANFNNGTSPVLLQSVQNSTLIRSGIATTLSASAGQPQTVITASPMTAPAIQTVIGVQPASIQIAVRSDKFLDASVRDDFFTLVARGEEKELLGIRGVMKSLINSVLRLF